MSIKKTVLEFIILLFVLPALPGPFVLVLDPAGDARCAGRRLEDNFERGISLQCVQALQKEIQNCMEQVNVLLTRAPGELTYDLQNAQFANKMGASLYISVHFFKEQVAVPRLYMYTYTQHDLTIVKPQSLCFMGYDSVSAIHMAITQAVSDLGAKQLHSSTNKCFQLYGPYRIPFKPLMGIMAPAIAFEIGLKHVDDWSLLIESLVSCIASMITFLEKQS